MSPPTANPEGSMNQARRSTEFRRTNLRLLLLSVPFFVLAVIGVVAEFRSSEYSWDIDHEMYFGQALWRGELLWTVEFHDKLPVLQYLFAVPAFFESVTIWRIISLFFALGSVATLVYFSSFLFPGESSRSRATALLASGIFLALIVANPGGLTHLNVVPTSSALIALVLMLRFFQESKETVGRIGLALLIAIFVTISVSIRPYFLFALIPAAVWLSSAYVFKSKESSAVRRVAIVLGLALTITFTGFAANSLPYFASSQGGAFFEGLGFLLSGLNPDPALDSFVSQLESGGRRSLIALLIASMLAAGLVWLLTDTIRPGSRPIFVRLVVLSSSMLALGVFLEHWWSHYSNFFSWYLSVFLAFSVSRFSDTLSAFEMRQGGRFSASLAISIPVFATLVIGIGVFGLKSFAGLPREHPEEWRLQAISLYLERNFESQVSFLSPDHMYSHWKLNEPRHGFPHAANTAHIIRGWWEQTDETRFFSSPKSSIDYCHEISDAFVAVVFLKPESPLDECFGVYQKGGGLTLADRIGEGEYQLEAWVRTP